MALDVKDNREHTQNRVRVPAPTEEEVRVSDRVDVTKLDLNDPAEFQLALVAYFEQLRDPRLTGLGGIPVDTSERRWMVALQLSDLHESIKNVGKNKKEEADEVSRLQKEASDNSKDEDNGPAIQTTDPRSRLDSILAAGRVEDDTVRRMATVQEDKQNANPSVGKPGEKK